MIQFSLKNILLAMLLVCTLFAFVSQEPLIIGLAGVYCVISWIASLLMIRISLKHLAITIGAAVSKRQLGHLTKRFRWAYLDALIATWLLFTIVVSNYILENSAANAKNLIWIGWTVWCVALIAVALQTRRHFSVQ